MRTDEQALTTSDRPTPPRRPAFQESGSFIYPADDQLYYFYWNQIRHLAPGAVLLRGPSDLHPFQAEGDSDLDILLTSNSALVEGFLAKQGFLRFYKPQAYLKRFRLFRQESSTRYTIELYTAEQWGLGFRLAGNHPSPADPDLARLLHATVDEKGISRFAPYPQDTISRNGNTSAAWNTFSGRIGRTLWERGSTRLLALNFILAGLIQPDFSMIGKTLLRKLGYRLWQLSHKTGLEVGVMGPDGAGKSSLARALLELPVPVRVIYMGHNEYHTRPMAYVSKRRFPRSMKKLVAGYDFFVRRLRGWILSRRGWVVIYDRHPAERLAVRPAGPMQYFANSLKKLYAWPLDLTFWLTGDYQKIYERKNEQSPSELAVMDHRFGEVLHHYRIRFEKINVTQEDASSVARITAERILATYQVHHSIDHASGLLGAILKP